MPARRSSSRSGAALALALAAIAACDRAPETRAPSVAPSAPSAPAAAAEAPLTSHARAAAKRAREAAQSLASALAAGRVDRPRYLAVRRAVGSGAALFRLRAEMGSEALLGPPRGADEEGGALARLDAALAARDLALASAALAQVDAALLLLDAELERSGVPEAAAGAALSAAAYDLGALALEAADQTPSEPDAVRADLAGLLDLVEGGGRALAASARDAPAGGAALDAALALAAPLRARVDAAATSLELRDRASFVVATGPLGARLRALAAAAGVAVRPPYPARVPVAGNGPDEPVTALTLPAPRRAPPGAPPLDDPALADLGAALFADRRLSRGGVRACATCHDPARAYADGLARPTSLDPAGPPLRHTPTLLYTSLHAAQLWDGRTLTAGDQALGVLHARGEMGLERGELLSILSSIPAYAGAFAKLEGGLSLANVARAFEAFEVRDLVPASAPIDRAARGDASALTADMRAGLDVFAGRGRCARCHVPPLFGGSRPKDFAVPVFAALGVPADPSGVALDPDRGRGAITRRPTDERAFKTPTVRDVARTAPYFHHGTFARLEDVVAFYDRGGGRGLGLDVPSQDPDVRPLGLSAEETRVLLVFQREALLDADEARRR
jgi:cytochrome c peroxidase